MTGQSVNIKGEIQELPALEKTLLGAFTIVDNRVSKILISPSRRPQYIAVHTQTGLMLPIMNDARHSRRQVSAFAQTIEDLGAFDAITGKPCGDTDVHTAAVSISRTWGM